MTEIKWQSPPEPQRMAAHDRNREFADALRANPGEWAIFKERASNAVASKIKHGHNPGFGPAGEFEATSRKHPEGLFTIYVRFVGGAA